MISKKTILLLTILSFPAFQLRSQDAAGTSDETERIVVTATEPGLTSPSIEKARAQAELTPGGTAVVDAEEYRGGCATSLKDALDFAPGVFVQSRFGAEESRVSFQAIEPLAARYERQPQFRAAHFWRTRQTKGRNGPVQNASAETTPATAILP